MTNSDKSDDTNFPVRGQPPVESMAKWIPSAEWLLLVLMTVYLGIHTLPAAWKTLNTDFPNYYLTARLARENSNTSQINEWIWLQRQKDHRSVDQRFVELVPITPFSTLAVWPFTAAPPLAAKHDWLILNMVLAAAVIVLLRSLTLLPWRHILLLVVLSVPLNKNLLYGQYYVLLLFVLTLACWCYVRQKRFLSGLLIGLGFGLKLFPLLYLGYFLRKRDIKAFVGGAIGSVCTLILSIAVYGEQANRVFFHQVVPWALRGEALVDPYALSTASVATLFHRIFIYEPQLNAHPSIPSAWMFAVLFPLAQMLLFAPALLLVEPNNGDPKRLRLEWSAVLIASLAISTAPAGYHFTLLILPVCLMWPIVEERIGLGGVAALLLLYTAIGYPGWKAVGAASRLTLFSVPRLYLVILLCCFVYWLLAAPNRRAKIHRDTWLWAGAFVLLMCLNIVSVLRHQSGLYADYQWRLPMADNVLRASGPVTQNDTILFTAMLPTGYHTATQNGEDVHFDLGDIDQLAVTANSREKWIEEAGRESSIASNIRGRESIPQAENPVASPNGRWLAYLREEHGRANLWLRLLDRPEGKDQSLTSPELNVMEMSFLPNGSLIFSAEKNGGRPGLYLVDQSGAVSSLDTDEARYPAISPDGHWFAYSKLQGGNWHLWLRDLRSGNTRSLTQADCNNVEPTWASDSKTLVYASDCGRALWFTALCRRRISE